MPMPCLVVNRRQNEDAMRQTLLPVNTIAETAGHCYAEGAA